MNAKDKAEIAQRISNADEQLCIALRAAKSKPRTGKDLALLKSIEGMVQRIEVWRLTGELPE